MPTTTEAFQAAFAHHQAGQLREAEQLYRQILANDPAHVDALHLLGLVAYQVGQHQAAVELIGRALKLGGERALFLGNLGEAYRMLGRHDDGEQALSRALELDPNLPDVHNSLGNLCLSQGRDARAIDCFRRALALRPEFAAAHNNLGTVLHARGEHSAAAAEFRRAIELNPDYVEALNNLGSVCQAQNQWDEAARCHQRALQIAPANVEAHFSLGLVHQAQGQPELAVGCYREALRLDPQRATAHNNLGSALMDLKRHDEAVASFREATALDPTTAEFQFNLGTAHHALEDWPAAAKAYGAAIVLQPEHVKALFSLGNVRQHQGRYDEALQLVDGAIALDPSLAKARLHRGNLYKLQRRPADAVAEYQAAIRLQPEYPEAYNNLAVLLIEIDQPDAALEACGHGLEQDPMAAALHANKSTALQNLGRADEAIAAARKSVELRPEGVGEYSNLLYKLNFHADYDAATIFGEHRAWAARHAEPLTAAAPAWPSVSSASGAPHRLRVGYVSPYFREHAVNFFTEPLITAHDSQRYEIFLYSDVALSDATTQRLRAAADHWRDTLALSDAQLAQLVRQDQIDILVDLTGHIAGSRLLAFARRPAPVQVTYLGYQNTTGMSAMDYRLTDDWADPPGMTERFHTEQLVRLPGAFFCYRPTPDAPEVNPLPAREQGYVTFGAVNNFAKVTPQVIEAWLQILKRAENARLLLLARGGGSIERQFCQRAGQQGVDPARIEFCPKRPRPQYLELFGRIDIALDPFPFNGHTTTCDSLWMGVPVVMRAGTTYASRFGGSALKAVGLDDLITESTAAYVERAVQLAAHLEALAELRQELRPRMAASPLLDAQGFTRRLEDAYQALWNQRCQKP